MTAPSIGRKVHYVARGSADGVFPPVCRSAEVTEVGDLGSSEPSADRVGLCVINPTGLFFHPMAMGGVPYSPNNEPGTWHWPERV